VLRLLINAGGGVTDGKDGVVGTTVAGRVAGEVEGLGVLVGEIVVVEEVVGFIVEVEVGETEGRVVVVAGLEFAPVEHPVKTRRKGINMPAVTTSFREIADFTCCITNLEILNYSNRF
jgi:hypothetical protein